MQSKRTCKECGKPILRDAKHNCCPHCLLALALEAGQDDTQDEALESGPPTPESNPGTLHLPLSSASPERFGSGQNHVVVLTTRWSVVLTARDGDPQEAFAALEGLCRSCWQPVYAYIRRQGHQPADGQDLIQEFFHRFIEKKWFDYVQQSGGKFRSFLLTFLKHFLSDERDRVDAQKRSAGQTLISLDELQAEENHRFEPSESLTADQVFERRWAETLMERAVARLRQEYADEGEGELFHHLKDLKPGERDERSYVELGALLGLSEGAVKSAIHRLRVRHRDILRDEIASTIGSAEEVDEEMRHLIRVLEK